MENTIEASTKAVDSGVRIIEADLLATKDGKLILAHDTNLERLTGKDVNVKDVNFSDLPNFQKDVLVEFWENQYYSDPSNVNKKFNLFTDFMTHFKGQDVYFNIEIKTEDEKDLENALKILKDLGMEDKVVFGMFTKSLKDFKPALGDFLSFVNTETATNIIISFFLGKLFVIFNIILKIRLYVFGI